LALWQSKQLVEKVTSLVELKTWLPGLAKQVRWWKHSAKMKLVLIGQLQI
jgi:hypothetical protein